MRTNFISTFFITLFGALLIVFQFASTADWTIHTWDGVISWATAENLDVSSRIASFYKAFGIFFLAFFLIWFLSHRFGRKIFTESELSILNYISLAGCMLLFFKLTGAIVEESLTFIFVMQLLVIIYACADYFLSKFSRRQSLSVHELAWSLMMGIAVYFLFNYLSLTFGYDLGTYFNKYLLLFSAGALYFSFWTGRKASNANFNRWIVSLKYVALIPLWFVLSQEIYMILNQHNIFSIHPAIIFLFLLLINAMLVIRKYRLERNASVPLTTAINSITGFYLPCMIVGLVAFTFYHPVVESSTEMFEQANPALSIQQYYEFGKLPWLQTFSSHSGADFLTGFFYTFFNSYSGLSYHCYDFLNTVIYVLVLFYALKHFTGNAYLSALAVLLYPYIILLIPSYHYFLLIPLLILSATVDNPSAKNYFLLFSALLLMPLWRYDLGYGNVIALIVSVFILMILRKEFRVGVSAPAKGFIWALIFPAILFVIALLKNHQSILINMQDALAYLNSAQASGLKDLAYDKNMVYYAHYFIFPCTVAVCFMFALHRLAIARKSAEKVSFINTAVVFLSVYYFVNFHRGLIRHNLAEGWDTSFSSFSYLIVTVTAYDFLRTKNSVLQLAAVGAFITLVIFEFKYPQPELSMNNYYNDLNHSMRHFTLAGIRNEKTDRAPVQPAFASETYADLKKFLDKNIPADATFLDFSNTPMLYFYTHRRTPNYFNQIPHTAFNDYLQQRLLEEQKEYKVPVVLFSNYPDQWWDHFDGIPNTYRHYKVAEYIYRYYQPYAIINKHTIWMDKGFTLKDTMQQYPKDTVSAQPKDYELKFLPYIMGKTYPVVMGDSLSSFKKFISDPLTIDEKMTMGMGTSCNDNMRDYTKTNYVLIKAKNLSAKRVTLKIKYYRYDNEIGSASLYLMEDSAEHAYPVRLSTDYNWTTKNFSGFNFSADGKCMLTDVQLMKIKR